MKHISIFLASDDNYAAFVATTAYSILEHTSSFIDFYVLDGGIKDSSKKIIQKSLKSFANYSIEYIDMSAFNLEQFPNLKHYSLNTFSRYFIPQLKPNLDKVLYLDVDIIVKDDIAKLYNQDLENYPLGAVLEDFYGKNAMYLKEHIYPEYKGGLNYFNAGILVMKLDYFRQNNLTELFIKMTSELAGKLSCPDQDILNIVFENNFKILDYRFNFMPDHFELLQKAHPDIAQESKENVVIYHYTSGKPWRNLSIASNDFWEVANKTKFKKIIKKKFAEKKKLKHYIFQRKRLPSGKRNIYIFSVKIASYTKKEK